MVGERYVESTGSRRRRLASRITDPILTVSHLPRRRCASRIASDSDPAVQYRHTAARSNATM
jgi:hypothetical protein